MFGWGYLCDKVISYGSPISWYLAKIGLAILSLSILSRSGHNNRPTSLLSKTIKYKNNLWSLVESHPTPRHFISKFNSSTENDQKHKAPNNNSLIFYQLIALQNYCNAKYLTRKTASIWIFLLKNKKMTY